jgi:hypothetical protein
MMGHFEIDSCLTNVSLPFDRTPARAAFLSRFAAHGDKSTPYFPDIGIDGASAYWSRCKNEVARIIKPNEKCRFLLIKQTIGM